MYIYGWRHPLKISFLEPPSALSSALYDSQYIYPFGINVEPAKHSEARRREYFSESVLDILKFDQDMFRN